MKRALLLAVAICGCSNSFTPSSFVSGLRVLAVKAEPPEVAEGQATSLTALAVDTAGAPVQVTWSACAEPALASNGPINPECFTTAPATFLTVLGDGLAITATAPAVDPTVFGPPDASGGLYLPVILHATSTSSAVDGAYQLRLSQGGPPNRNPQLTGVFVVPSSGAPVPLDEASPLVVHEGDAITLQAQFTADSAERYQSAVPGQSATVTEILKVSWFATGGSLSESATGQAKPNTIWRADTRLPPPGTTIDLYAVGRDERGGTDYLHRRLILR